MHGLAIAYLNLVPACSDIDKAKLTNITPASEDVSIRPCFDEVVNERRLRTDVVQATSSLPQAPLTINWGKCIMFHIFNMISKIYGIRSRVLTHIHYSPSQENRAARDGETNSLGRCN